MGIGKELVERIRRPAKRVALLGLILLAVATWAFAKPVRMIAPGIHGLACQGAVCVERAERMVDAVALYDDAYKFVESRLSQFDSRPRMIFCSTAECYRTFGGGKERAISYPVVGSLISSDAWKAHFVRHELIHHLQFQELGAVATMLDPEWFREGMAYSVSEPPVNDLPPQFRKYQARYDQWVSTVASGQLWSAAKKL